jgi:hypothetical protein
MSDYYFADGINLHVKGQISADDAARQQRTAAEILRRLNHQPGLILADEVGMGKTFVALAVAVSVAVQNQGRRPVVVMVPSSLKEKWPTDFNMMAEKCLSESFREQVRCVSAERAVEFLKLLDDPPERRKSVIFLTHGAMSRGLDDPWVMLALIRQSLQWKRDVDDIRKSLCRNMDDLLRFRKEDRQEEAVWEQLLGCPPAKWKDVLDKSTGIADDPVPLALCSILSDINTNNVFDVLREIPIRKSINYGDKISSARKAIRKTIQDLWAACLKQLDLQLPLLILDEAHHLKNADTRLSSLFRSTDAKDDAEELSKGPLASVFERMLFLTATPFQLGHGELCSVLDRFDGIRWMEPDDSGSARATYAEERKALRNSLDAANIAANNLDHAWGKLTPDDLVIADRRFQDPDSWWAEAIKSENLTPVAIDAVRAFGRTLDCMKRTEEQLRKWVVRHIKAKQLPGDFSFVARRKRHVGKAICPGEHETAQGGITVSGDSLLPFLLAARASAQSPEARPVFAEGLASSYEAFLKTRQMQTESETGTDSVVDGDDDPVSIPQTDDSSRWYLDQLERLIPRDGGASGSHPKMAATVQRVVELWKAGEKCVVFCHYIATGRALRVQISDAIRKEILAMGATKLKCSVEQVSETLSDIGDRFFRERSDLRQECDRQTTALLSEFPILFEDESLKSELIESVRRNLRTPAFLVRFFPLNEAALDDAAVETAFAATDSSGQSLRSIVRQFFAFLAERCAEDGRKKFVDAVKRIQTGSHFGVDVGTEYDSDEPQESQPEQLMPNVRLINGTTKSETRQRLMLTFNTPFYPEILIASSVMAEGVDLHLNCRHIIHHDLCWNPSTLEQRTGRVDRIGAKAEAVGQSVQIYLPFIAETQDEKMYRVVMDRERWFSVVMGDDYKIDLRTTDKLADRIPFPASAAAELAFQLNVP